MPQRPVDPAVQRTLTRVMLGLAVVSLILVSALAIGYAIDNKGLAGLGWVIAAFFPLLGVLLVNGWLNHRDWGQPDPIAALKSHERLRKWLVLIGSALGAVLLGIGVKPIADMFWVLETAGLVMGGIFAFLAVVVLAVGVSVFLRTEKYPEVIGAPPPGDWPAPGRDTMVPFDPRGREAPQQQFDPRRPG